MAIEAVPEPLATFLRTYCDVNAMDMVQVLRERLQHKEISPETATLFRQQFIDAIHKKGLTPEQYKALTGDNEYATPEELEAWLSELWSEIFVGEEIPE